MRTYHNLDEIGYRMCRFQIAKPSLRVTDDWIEKSQRRRRTTRGRVHIRKNDSGGDFRRWVATPYMVHLRGNEIFTQS